MSSPFAEPTNKAGLVTLRERPWSRCPDHDHELDGTLWDWCPDCCAEQSLRNQDYERSRRVRELADALRIVLFEEDTIHGKR